MPGLVFKRNDCLLTSEEAGAKLCKINCQNNHSYYNDDDDGTVGIDPGQTLNCRSKPKNSAGKGKCKGTLLSPSHLENFGDE